MFRCLKSIHAQRAHVPNFRVTHESLLETDGEAGRLELDNVVVVTNRVHRRGVGMVDSIALLLVGKSPTVMDAAVR